MHDLKEKLFPLIESIGSFLFDIQSCGNKSIVPFSSLTSTSANIRFPPNCGSRKTRFVLTNLNGLTHIVVGVNVTDGTYA
jgi:hypothetical protein